MDEEVCAAPRTPERSPFRGDARIAGLRACRLAPRRRCGARGHRSRDFAGTGRGGRGRRAPAGQEGCEPRPPSESPPPRDSSSGLGGPEGSEVGTQTQVKERGLVAFPRSAPPPPLASPHTMNSLLRICIL